MSDFSTSASLFVELNERSVKRARSSIEERLAADPVAVEATVDRPGSMLADGGSTNTALAGGLGGGLAESFNDTTSLLTESLELASDRNELLHDIRDFAERGALSGGGGGGGIADTVVSYGILSTLSGGLGSLLGTTSLGALVSKVSLSSLLKRAPAFATLVTAADLSTDLVRGKLTADDLVNAPIELGHMVTFGHLNSKAVEAGIGTVTLAVGTYQIGSIVSGTLTGSALASYFGTTSLSGMLSGVGGGKTLAGLLGTAGLGTILTGLGAGALAGLLGTVAISEIITGGSVEFDLSPDGPRPNIDRVNTGTATPTLGPAPSELEGRRPGDTPREEFEDLSPAERQERAKANQTWTMNATVMDTNPRPEQTASEPPREDSPRGKRDYRNRSRSNSARESRRNRTDVSVENDVTIDLSDLGREFDRLEARIKKDVKRELEREIQRGLGP